MKSVSCSNIRSDIRKIGTQVYCVEREVLIHTRVPPAGSLLDIIGMSLHCMARPLERERICIYTFLYLYKVKGDTQPFFIRRPTVRTELEAKAVRYIKNMYFYLLQGSKTSPPWICTDRAPAVR